jgi:hypothetical protein
MDKPEKPGMQQDAVEPDRQRRSLAAIESVSNQRVTKVRQMDADLVRTPGPPGPDRPLPAAAP